MAIQLQPDYVRYRPITFAYTHPLIQDPALPMTRLLTRELPVRRWVLRALKLAHLIFIKPRPTALDLRIFRQRLESHRRPALHKPAR